MNDRRLLPVLAMLASACLGMLLNSCRQPPPVSPAQQEATKGSMIDLAALRQATDPEYLQRSEACRRTLDENRSVLRRYGFQEPEGLDGWVVEAAQWELADGKLRTSAPDRRLSLTLEPEFDCRQVQRVKIRMRRFKKVPGGRIVVHWAGPGQTLGQGRMLSTPLRKNDWFYIYDMEVGDHPGWGGEITALRVEFLNIEKGAVVDTIIFEKGLSVEEEEMLRIEGGIDGAELAIDDQTRPAMRTPSGAPCSIPLTLPAAGSAAAGAGEGPVLVFGTGVSRQGWITGGNPVRFRVSIECEQSGVNEPLFDQTLDPVEHPGHRYWLDHEVSLAAYAGKQVRLTFSSEDTERSDPPGTGAFAVWAHPMVLFPAPRPKNVLVILVDTLRADHVSGYGYPVRSTPHLDRWARRGTLFREAVSSSNWTAPAVASLVTGQQPYRHGIRSQHSLRLGEEARTLAERFRDSGYVTGAISDNMLITPENGFAQGFHTFLSQPWDRLERGAREFTDQALIWLERNRQRPFFLYLHYMDPHGRYTPEEPFHPGPPGSAPGIRGFVQQGDCGEVTRQTRLQPGFRLTSAEQQHLIDLYDGEIAMADFHIARVLGWLKQTGLIEQTFVIFLADHGEGFGEHGVYSHTHTLHDEEVRIPLVVLAPGDLQVKQAARIPGIVRMVDLAPTISELAGLAADDGLAGRSLVPLMKAGTPSPGDTDAFCENAIYARPNAPTKMDSALRYGGMKLIFNAGNGRTRMFDLISDPGEQVNIFSADDHRAVSLMSRLDRYLSEAAREYSAPGEELDSVQLRQLEALGYLDN